MVLVLKSAPLASPRAKTLKPYAKFPLALVEVATPAVVEGLAEEGDAVDDVAPVADWGVPVDVRDGDTDVADVEDVAVDEDVLFVLDPPQAASIPRTMTLTNRNENCLIS